MKGDPRAGVSVPLTDAQVIENRDDREMLLRPHLWPQQAPVVVYLRREPTGKGWRHTGPCTIDGGRYLVKDHDWGDGDRGSLKVTIKHYDTVDALLADGWTVD